MDIKKLLIEILFQLLDKATSGLKEDLCQMMRALEKRAKNTPNPVDDILVEALKHLLGCKSQ